MREVEIKEEGLCMYDVTKSLPRPVKLEQKELTTVAPRLSEQLCPLRCSDVKCSDK